jgi:hypothetical protein
MPYAIAILSIGFSKILRKNKIVTETTKFLLFSSKRDKLGVLGISTSGARRYRD